MIWILYIYFAIAITIAITLLTHLSIRDGFSFWLVIDGILFGLIWPMLVLGVFYWLVIILLYKTIELLYR